MKIRYLILFLLAAGLSGHAQTLPVNGKFELMALPYAADALEPAISRTTVELHHGKHLRGYVNTLNGLLAGSPFEGLPLEQIVARADGPLFDNAGQLLNHNLYFAQFSADGPRTPQGELAKAIGRRWGSFDNFKKEFVKAGVSRFGSGWVWLASDPKGNLLIVQEANGGNPVSDGLVPLLGFDVWEHAYYLDYHNRRADHLDALWQIVNWDTVSERYPG